MSIRNNYNNNQHRKSIEKEIKKKRSKDKEVYNKKIEVINKASQLRIEFNNFWNEYSKYNNVVIGLFEDFYSSLSNIETEDDLLKAQNNFVTFKKNVELKINEYKKKLEQFNEKKKMI